MINILDELKGVNRVGITGHIRPDGDCLGSCSALYSYIKDNCENVVVNVHLESVPEVFTYLEGAKLFDTEYNDEEPYDVFFCLDCGSLDRIGNAKKYFDKAKKTISIDHHISNIGYSNMNNIVSDASSTCEVLFDMFEYDRISNNTAVALYTGIIHDTGVLKQSNTTPHTMMVASKLIEKDVDFPKIIDESFYQKTLKQNKLLGYALLNSDFYLEGKCVISTIPLSLMQEYRADSSDLEGIVAQLRVTKGVEVAMFLHETEKNKYKVSFRANFDVDVNKVASFFGGGGHIKASGCTIEGELDDVIRQLTDKIKEQLDS